MSWLETVRSTVHRWEIDNTDHFTVAYYFARLGDAAFAMLDALGLDPTRVLTADAYVRYQHELRVGDIFHIESGVIEAGDDTLLVGHKIFESGAGTLCTTVEHRFRGTISADARRKAEAYRVSWDGPKREARPQPRGLEGFTDAARDTVRPWEVDVTGGSALSHYIHRFSASNGHSTNAFGLNPAFYRDQRRGFSTFEFQLAVDRLLRPGDQIVVKSAPLHVGNTSLRMFHQMVDVRTGARVAALDQLGVLLDLDARRPSPLPDWMKDRAKALLAPTA
ncbi:MAG: thioesterase family protein [Candidatus Rokubacteria bacterium]|nr:thioesterase family protein [Candidatus Rokubacteria bacterium]